MSSIKNIKSLSNFGIFQSQNCSGLSEFRKYNLIYGWNRCGKTTISRVFASCEKKSTYNAEAFKQFPENGEFELTLSDNSTLQSKNIIQSDLPIKVFNQDFIEDNVSFDPTKSSNGIVYLSEVDIQSKEKLEKLKEENIRLKSVYDECKKTLEGKEKVKNTFLQSVGREVANKLFDKTYNRSKVENQIAVNGVETFSQYVLSDNELIKYEEIAKRKKGNGIECINNVEIKLDFLVDIDAIYGHVKSLLNKKVVAETLDRLKDDEELNKWVKNGLELHKSRDEFGKCLFCENPLSSNLFDILSKHFSKDYNDLLINIEFFLKYSQKIKLSPIPSENKALYIELQEEYATKVEQLNSRILLFNDWLFYDVSGLLSEKYNKPFDTSLAEDLQKPINYQTEINDCIDSINTVIKTHNNLVDTHNEQVDKAKAKIELHVIATALIQGDYSTMSRDVSDSTILLKKSLKEFTESQRLIEELEKKTSEIRGALIKINSLLSSFFGKSQITLEPDQEEKGYLIYRDGNLASNLSEGEKTAIAFSYFIVKVEERDSKIEDSIIFIDDPISSFDSNYIYHCYSLIKEHFGKVGQLFISTHNFQLFNLVKDWFVQKNTETKRDNYRLSKNNKRLKPMPCEFYMISSFLEDEKRKSEVRLLDETLRKFKSEYHFLFNQLHTFLGSTQQYIDLYTIGNISRRFFEIYADFKVPNSGDAKQKMEHLLKVAISNGATIPSTSLEKIYKLINEYSHNYNPMSSIEHTDKSECCDAIRLMLEIVKYSDQSHYDILARSCKI